MSDSPDNLQQVEKATIERVLADCGGNKSAAVKRLGIDRSVLYRKLTRLQLIEQSPVCPTCGAERG